MREPEWQEVRAPAQRQLAQQQRLSKLQGRAAAAAAASGGARRPEAADYFPPINGASRSAGSSRTVSPGPARATADLSASNGALPAAPSSSAREVFPALSPPAASARQLNLRSWGPGMSQRPSCEKGIFANLQPATFPRSSSATVVLFLLLTWTGIYQLQVVLRLIVVNTIRPVAVL